MDDVADLTVVSSSTAHCLGVGLAVGDVDGSRRPDLVVGSPCSRQEQSSEGAVFLLLDPTLDGGVRDVRLDAIELEGTTNGGDLGAAVGVADDLTGDGHRDLVVMEPGWPLPSDPTTAAGRLLIFSGQLPWSGGTVEVGDAIAQLTGVAADAAAVRGASIGADLNGDGDPDAILALPSANGAAPAAGRVSLLFGTGRGWSDSVTSDSDADFVGVQRSEGLGGSFSVADVPGYGPALLLGSPALAVGGRSTGGVYVIPLDRDDWSHDMPADEAAAAILVGTRSGSALGAGTAVVENWGPRRGALPAGDGPRSQPRPRRPGADLPLHPGPAAVGAGQHVRDWRPGWDPRGLPARPRLWVCGLDGRGRCRGGGAGGVGGAELVGVSVAEELLRV